MVDSETFTKSTNDSVAADEYSRVMKSTNPSYIVYKENSTYYARKSAGAASVLYSDTNFKDLITTAIEDLYGSGGTGQGGWIHMRAGYYYADDTIQGRAGVHIEGECRSCSDVVSGLCTKIYTDQDIPIFKFDSEDNGKNYGGGLRFLALRGKGYATSTQPVVDILGTNYITGDVMFHTVFMHYGKYGLRIRAVNNLIWNHYFDSCYFESNGYAGVFVENAGTGIIKQTKFVKCHFYGNNTEGGNGAFEVSGSGELSRGNILALSSFELENLDSIYLDTAIGWIIQGNPIFDGGQDAPAGTHAGIRLVDSDYNAINGNVIYNEAGTSMAYGIDMDANSDNNALTGNVCNVRTDGIRDLGTNQKAGNVENPDP